jgi:hypothetical protein
LFELVISSADDDKPMKPGMEIAGPSKQPWRLAALPKAFVCGDGDVFGRAPTRFSQNGLRPHVLSDGGCCVKIRAGQRNWRPLSIPKSRRRDEYQSLP